MVKAVTLATCNLNQWALDFKGNLERIIESIKIAKNNGAKYRLGPELEISGYGCEDHFYEQDTHIHSWMSVATLLDSDLTNDIIVDVGMPVLHKGVRYNCRVILYNKQIVLITPKKALAMDGNYRENRWFTPWLKPRTLETYYLPKSISDITGQESCPIGDAIISTLDTAIASETCEELFLPNSPHIEMGLDGVEIITNGSGSHHQLRKLCTRVDLIKSATSKSGGIYLYANQQGCDGGRLYYDGCCMVMINGDCVAQGSQFSLNDVEVIIATLDLDDVRSFRASFMSRCSQATLTEEFPRVRCLIRMSNAPNECPPRLDRVTPIHYISPVEEIGYGPACWLWDYLRRSGLNGYYLPLSGGADSAATAAIVAIMCQLVVMDVSKKSEQVIRDVQRITNDKNYIPTDAKELASRIFFTAYLATKNSSKETRDRAALIASQVGAIHKVVEIDQITDSFGQAFSTITNKIPKFKVQGGSNRENLALQNVQARARMVMSYHLATLLLWEAGREGSLLVLGSANVDESLRGYMTKYDCSSADINPIGGISKVDLKRFLKWAAEHKNLPALLDVLTATPTAELEPTTENYVQSDEVDMGMTYEELNEFGRLRKINRCGPVTMFERLVADWNHLKPEIVAEKVKRFFYYYAINRHKMTTITPSYHAEAYSPDDNRYDHRPFLYNTKWDSQFKLIDELVTRYTSCKSVKQEQPLPTQL
ncbi:glutamine-dependent NAD+ synthetase [Heterostelium album PN500]|uniref:Glutamine-dependent NAD(+) synthetase n=1 Tax=Heterostelium pallidum (strain ATCC 26659 / Pp 5 / PN500) TaxID=670386 RepID=D3B5K0_HETP5|nr:glutamine-dependent NAD+ synthetase [Heterostelium album PN500]EFA83148.1 glutamine-dependent NAD+ synthetase [Heterostelium album PN500]|eukprot:XP_020435265.1 glutamine-dependent NAD+ synthetase [Heterostelium album PN500]